MADLESLLYFLETTFETTTFPDYPNALNGLQVQGRQAVERVGVAVDASEETIAAAAADSVNLLLVHHGLFWDGLKPLTGPRYRKADLLIKGGMSLYSLHLPLDAHPALGNNVLLLEALGLQPAGRFAPFQGTEIGWWAECGEPRGSLLDRLRGLTGAGSRLIPGGPEEVRRIGVVSGGGASAMVDAASAGLDTLITGEASHHAYHEAMERGLNLLLGGHYATETFGVRQVGALLADEFGVSWTFLDFPTGL